MQCPKTQRSKNACFCVRLRLHSQTRRSKTRIVLICREPSHCGEPWVFLKVWGLCMVCLGEQSCLCPNTAAHIEGTHGSWVLTIPPPSRLLNSTPCVSSNSCSHQSARCRFSQKFAPCFLPGNQSNLRWAKNCRKLQTSAGKYRLGTVPSCQSLWHGPISRSI